MANKDDYLTEYRRFFEDFANTLEPNDQLPVKLGSYKFINSEVIGGIVDWCLQYLNKKSCPSSLVAPLIKMTIDEIRQACKKQPIACGFSPNENVYQPLKLMQAVMNKMNEICLRCLDNSELDKLPAPETAPPLVSVFAARNIRRRMEDRHVVIHDLNTMFNIEDTSPSSYYAIFDGHAGQDAASYSAAHLHQFLAESEYYPTDPERALREAFLRTDEFFLEKSRIENFRSGTTAVCALLQPKQKTLYVAWVGDSLALLVNRGKVLQIVNAHKPCREDERDRIQGCGGRVIYWGIWRVNGQLAVSRAIGNIKLKPYVTAEPDIAAVPLDGNEDFLIMACDGLWDFVSEDDAALAVYQSIRFHPESIDTIAEYLVDIAKQSGSHDNISVIVIFLRDPVLIAKDRTAEWGWAAIPGAAMDTTSVDNSNNATNNAYALFDILQKRSPLLDQRDDFKQNGTTEDTSPSMEPEVYFTDRQTNGKRSADEFDEDDEFGPETDIDAVDDVLLSPATVPTTQEAEENANNNPREEVDRMDTVDIDLELQRQQTSEFEPVRKQREETPTPPADSVLDNSGIADNVAESGDDSEDEWNYYRVDPKQKESGSSVETTDKVSEQQPEQEESEEMSQLNPDAKEFVPVSPTRHSTVSPTYNRDVVEDMLIAQSPRRAVPMDISVPSPVEFQYEVKQRPSDVFDEFSKGNDSKNGHQLSTQELMQNLLNGRDASEIEFHPSNNATSPADKCQPEKNCTSEGQTKISSTDNETSTTGAVKSTDVPELKDDFDFSKCDFIPKQQDPMSMSFYQDKDEVGQAFNSNPFDLNKVQILPDDSDELEESGNETQSEKQDKEVVQESGDAKLIYTPELKPVTPIESLFETDEICEISKSPAPDNVCETAKSAVQTPDDSEGPKSPPPSETSETSKSPLQEDICQLSKSPIPDYVCLIAKSPVLENVTELPKSPLLDDICELSKSPLQDELCELSKSPLQDVYELSKSPLQDDFCGFSKSPLQDEICEFSKSPLVENIFELSKTPLQDEICEFSKSPMQDLLGVTKLPSDVDEAEFTKSPISDNMLSLSPARVLESPKSPLENNYELSKSPLHVDVSEITKSPLLDIHSPVELSSPVGPLSPKSPIPELTGLVSPDITASVKDENISGEISEGAKSPILIQPSPMATPVDDLLKSPIQELVKEELSKSPLLLFSDQAPTPDITKSASPAALEDPTECLDVDKVPSDASLSPAPGSAHDVDESQKSEDLPEDEKGITDFTKETLSELIEKSSSIVEEISHEGVTKTEEVFCEINKDASAVQQLLSDAIADITQATEQEADKETNKINEEKELVAQSPIETIVDEIKKDTADLEEEVYDADKGTTHALEHTFEEMEKRAVHLAENVTEISKDVWSTMPSLGEEMKNNITGVVENIWSHPEPAEKAYTIVDDIKKEISETVEQTIDNINTEKGNIVATAKELASELIDEKAEAENISETKNKTVIDDEIIERNKLNELNLTNVSNEIIEPVQQIVQETIEIVAAVPDELNFSNVESELTPSEVNSFLERSVLPDVTSPLSPTEYLDQIPQHQRVEITCQTIEPQYPVPIIASPSEESKGTDTPPPAVVNAEPELKPRSHEPEKIIEAVEKLTEKPADVEQKDDAVLIAAVVAAEVATAGVVAAAVTAVVSKTGSKLAAKPKTTTTTAKKSPITRSTPTSPTKPLPGKTAATAIKKTSASTLAPKSATAKPSTPKSKTTTPVASPRLTTTTAKPAPKLRTSATTATSKPLVSSDKKPMTNGDVKVPIKQNLIKKSTLSTLSAKPALSKLSPTKTPTTTSKPTLPITKTTTAPAKTLKASVTSTAAPKPRPASFSSKTSTTAATAKLAAPKTSAPKPATTAAPKPRPPTTSTLLKPRSALTVTKTAAKAPDTEKQIKETANKQLSASRTTTTRTTTTTTASRLTAAKKTDAKAPISKTTTRTTTSTLKSSTTSKKPTEVTRTSVTKTKAVAIKGGMPVPDKNGVVDVLQQITTVTVVADEPQLLKDNSPVEPTPLIDNSQLPASALLAD